ncbi:hypothetical protein evm_004019 [Chilo suppressalis]|nr:hypothetical protein evm_004019 [Chilo suppressalis]
MSQAAEDWSYTIQPVTKDDVEKIIALLKKTFYVDEPLNEAVELWNENQPCEELDEYCVSSLLKGYSFKAVDKQGNIVGAMISGVCNISEDTVEAALKEAEQCKNPKFQRILYILAKREEGARLWEKFPKENELVEIKVAATDPKWRRRGIMNKLVAETEKLLKERKIRVLRLDTSSAYSAMSAERMGFTCVYRARYRDLKKDGQPLVLPKEPHIEDCVYVKELFD